MKITFLVGGCGGVGWVSAEHYTPTVDCDTTHGTCVQQHRSTTVHTVAGLQPSLYCHVQP